MVVLYCHDFPQFKLQPKMLTEHDQLHVATEVVAAASSGDKQRYLASKRCSMTYTNVCTFDD